MFHVKRSPLARVDPGTPELRGLVEHCAKAIHCFGALSVRAARPRVVSDKTALDARDDVFKTRSK